VSAASIPIARSRQSIGSAAVILLGGFVASRLLGLLRDVLVEYEALLDKLYRPLTYASLRFSADTGDAATQALYARVQEHATTVGNLVKFLDIGLKQAPDAVFAAWLAASERTTWSVPAADASVTWRMCTLVSMRPGLRARPGAWR